MNPNRLVDVFPINQPAFAFPAGWFESFSSVLIQPAYLLMALFLVISVGVMVLRGFEGVDWERKVWNIPVTIVAIGLWPKLILNLKSLIDVFNTFLIRDVFKIQWDGFGFRSVESIGHIFGWTGESIARLLPNLAYWILYAFYMTFFFLYAVMGPFVIAKGILAEEIDNFLELIVEVATLFLWQTMVVVLVAFIVPEIVSGSPFPARSGNHVYFLSFVLGVMLFFVPNITRKFVIHLGYSVISPSVTRGSALVVAAGVGKLGRSGLALAGVHGSLTTVNAVKKLTFNTEDLIHRKMDRKERESLEHENDILEKRLHDAIQPDPSLASEDASEESPAERSRAFLDLTKKAKSEGAV